MLGWHLEVIIDSSWLLCKTNLIQLHFDYDFYFIIGKVFNVTSYIKQHPGGVTPIAKAIGKDGTEFFDSVGHVILK